MLTIRKKLAEQAASQGQDSGVGGVGGGKRRLSFRSQLLTAGRGRGYLNSATPIAIAVLSVSTEASELGEVLPSRLCGYWCCWLLSRTVALPQRPVLCTLTTLTT